MQGLQQFKTLLWSKLKLGDGLRDEELMRQEFSRLKICLTDICSPDLESKNGGKG